MEDERPAEKVPENGTGGTADPPAALNDTIARFEELCRDSDFKGQFRERLKKNGTTRKLTRELEFLTADQKA